MLQRARCLRELAERHGLHGLYFQHIALRGPLRRQSPQEQGVPNPHEG